VPLTLDEFVEAVAGKCSPARAAAFAAAVLCEQGYNPDEPRDWRGRWTTDGSGTSGNSGISYADWLDAVQFGAAGISSRNLSGTSGAGDRSREPGGGGATSTNDEPVPAPPTKNPSPGTPVPIPVPPELLNPPAIQQPGHRFRPWREGPWGPGGPFSDWDWYRRNGIDPHHFFGDLPGMA
jgi:hypothetical protein